MGRKSGLKDIKCRITTEIVEISDPVQIASWMSAVKLACRIALDYDRNQRAAEASAAELSATDTSDNGLVPA